MLTLEEKIDLLPTKEDVKSLFRECCDELRTELRTEFNDKLAERDATISSLIERIERLEKGTPIALLNNIKADELEDDRAVPVTKAELLIVGDSIPKWVDPAKVARKDSISKLVCLPGKKTGEIKEAVKAEIAEVEYESIVVHSGTNSIPHDTPRKVANELIQAAVTLKEMSPKSNVLLSEVLPKIKGSTDIIPGIHLINFYLHQAAMYLDFQVIPHPSFIKNNNIDLSLFAKKEVEENRPTHLSGKGVVQFARDIKAVLKNNNFIHKK